MSDTSPRRLRKVSITTVIALLMTTVVSTAVIASHTFTDVPDDNTFHQDIEWMDAYDVTRGCNPPANDEFCPADNVTREQMAAFMRRLTETFGAAGDQVTDDSDPVNVDDTTLVELGEITVTPKFNADVVLNAHTTIAANADSTGSIEIHRGECGNEVLAAGEWTLETDAVGTVSITGVDVASASQDYVLCISLDGGDVDAGQRALTASWSPVGR